MKFILFLLISISVYALEKNPHYVSDGLYIQGYDPVSYIKSNEAKKGKKTISYDYKGTKVLFSSEENKKLFKSNPEKYNPAYNGYCAYAMADSGDLVEIDPKSFKVIDGKTYLFYDGFFSDTLEIWNDKDADEDQVNTANKNWNKYQ